MSATVVTARKALVRKGALLRKTEARGFEASADGHFVFFWPVVIPGDVEKREGADQQGHIVSRKSCDDFAKKYAGRKLKLDLNHETAPVPSVEAEIVQATEDIDTPNGVIKAGTAMGRVETDDEHLAAFLRKAGNGLSLFGDGKLTPLDAAPAKKAAGDEDEEPTDGEEDPEPKDDEEPQEPTEDTGAEADLMAVALGKTINEACKALELSDGAGTVDMLMAWFGGHGKESERFELAVKALSKADGFDAKKAKVLCAYLESRAGGKA